MSWLMGISPDVGVFDEVEDSFEGDAVELPRRRD